MPSSRESSQPRDQTQVSRIAGGFFTAEPPHQVTNIGKDMEKREPLYTVGENVNWYSHLPTMQETQVQSLGQEDLLEKEMATHFSIFAWKIPWTEEPGSLQLMGVTKSWT